MPRRLVSLSSPATAIENRTRSRWRKWKPRYPATQRFRTLASSRSLLERNPLEGGRDYTVAGLMPDESGARVVLYCLDCGMGYSLGARL